MITAIRFKSFGISAFGSLHTGGTSAFVRNAVGFMHALERKLHAQGLSLGTQRRIAVGVEEYSLNQGEKNYSSAKMGLSRPWKGQSNQAPAVLDYEWKCNAILTLIITSQGQEERENLERTIRELVPSMRFGNGSIFMVNDAATFVNILSGNDTATLTRAIRSVNAMKTYFINNKEDLIVAGDEFNSFADALALFEAKTEAAEEVALDPLTNGEKSELEGDSATVVPTKKSWKRKQPGWVIPIERGYVAVTQPVFSRPGSRNPQVPSIVVTPAISLGEYVCAKTVIKNPAISSIFWTSQSDRLAGSFLFHSFTF